VGVSGIVGGKALRGPADRMLASLGGEATALGVARRYAAAGLLDGFVLDSIDAELAEDVRAIGLEPLVTATVMTDDAARAALAKEVLAFAAGLSQRSAKASAGGPA
jgi:LPPG:FO 2-phospho-L-lactate transferase